MALEALVLKDERSSLGADVKDTRERHAAEHEHSDRQGRRTILPRDAEEERLTARRAGAVVQRQRHLEVLRGGAVRLEQDRVAGIVLINVGERILYPVRHVVVYR